MEAPTIHPRKRILDEEEYIELLGQIIERDYFPETAKHKQLLGEINQLNKNEELNKLSVKSFFEQFTSEDNASFDELHAKDLEDHRKLYHWAYEAITNTSEQDNTTKNDNKYQAGMLMLYYLNNKKLTLQERAKMDSILNAVDPMSSVEQRQNAPNTWSFRVRNQVMFSPDLKDSEDICRITEQYRSSTTPMLGSISNPLPQLTGSNGPSNPLILGHSSTSSSSTVNNHQMSVYTNQNDRVGRPPRSAKTVVPSNTSLRSSHIVSSTTHSNHTPSWTSSFPLEAPHTPSVLSDAISHSTEDAYRLVNMTPLLLPAASKSTGVQDSSGSGGVDVLTGFDDVEEEGEAIEPIMTYGVIAALPAILDPTPTPVPTPTTTLATSGYRTTSLYPSSSSTAAAPYTYEMLPERRRDSLARVMEKKRSISRHKKSIASIYQTTVPVSDRSSGGGDTQSLIQSSYTPGAGTKHTSSKRTIHTRNTLHSNDIYSRLSPAAVNLAKKISARKQGSNLTSSSSSDRPFGGAFT